MNETSDLARVLAQCTQRLRDVVAPGVSPVLRLERGAGLVKGPRARQVSDLLEPLLALVGPLLFVPASTSAVANLVVRPKLRVGLRLGGAGLIAQARYFGAAPADADLMMLYREDSASGSTAPACAMPSVMPPAMALAALDSKGIVLGTLTNESPSPPSIPPWVQSLVNVTGVCARGEVCLHALWYEPARRWPLVRVMAGGREVAVPMFGVEQAVSEDSIAGELPSTRSLAQCLGEEPSPSVSGRPALLVLRRRGPKLALRVEALLGHGNELVHSVGPLLQSAPWILGVIGGDESRAPLLVIDPLALPGLHAESA
jgi:hypothetical protein